VTIVMPCVTQATETPIPAMWNIEDMLPAARGALWKKPHLVTTYGVICKPGMVGASRPDAMVRGVDGLWVTGDTTPRARDRRRQDRALRADDRRGGAGTATRLLRDSVRY
jgi:hypothetical protein